MYKNIKEWQIFKECLTFRASGIRANDSNAYSGWLKRCRIFRRAKLVIREAASGSVFCKKYAEKNGSPFAYKHANRGRQSEIFITHPSRSYPRSLGFASRLVASFCLSRAKFIDGYHRSSVFLSIPSCMELSRIELHSLSNFDRGLLILVFGRSVNEFHSLARVAILRTSEKLRNYSRL